MCLWLPRWPLQRLCLVRPELKHRPVVLYAPARRGGWQVVHASRAALARGAVAGMTLAEAQALLGGSSPSGNGRCLAAHFEPWDVRADRELLESLAGWSQRYSPLVGLGTEEPAESLLMDLTGCAPLFGGESALAAQVVRDVHQAGFFPRAAIADTVGSAWALARFAPRPGREFVIRERQSPPGPDVLPLAALRLPAAVVETLHELGIETIGQLRSLPRSSLPSRLGPAVLERLDQMSGALPELIVPIRPLEPVEADWSFEFPTAERATLEAAFRLLLEQIVEQLAPREQGVQRLACRLFCVAGGEPVSLTLGTLRPRTTVPDLLELVHLLLEQTALPSEVLRIHVEATGTGRVESEQFELFDGGRHPGRERDLARLVDRLSSRLGRDSVLKPQPVADSQPEHAVRFESVPAGRPAADAATTRPTSSTPSGYAFRPLLLKRPPQAIEVISMVPDGPPRRFYFSREEHDVRASWGPERIETGWWRGPQVRRDYYRVETAAARRFWLFRRQPEGDWFLHGTFE